MNDKHNLAMDLKRICSWILQGSDELVDRVLDRDIKLYSQLDIKIGKFSIVDWLVMIKNRSGGKEASAERALTAAAILLS